MDKKTKEIAEKSFYMMKRYREEILELCNGQSVSFTISVLLASADYLVDTAQEIREQTDKRKRVWDIIKLMLEET